MDVITFFENFSNLSDPYSPQGEYGGLEESSVLPVVS